MQVNSPVLLNFIHGTHHYTSAGYQFDNFVLTAATPSLWNLIKNSCAPLKDDNFIVFNSVKNTRFKLRCYRLENSTIIYEDACRLICAVSYEPINLQLERMSKNKLAPYSPDILNDSNPIGNQLYFLLFQIGIETVDYSILRDKLKSLQKYSSEINLFRGQDVYIEYAPFGANEFMNSYARGCLSNLIDKTLYLIDERLAPGCEGAPLYIRKTGNSGEERPIGIVLFPIALKDDHSSYSVAAPLNLVSTILLKNLYPNEDYPVYTESILLDSASLHTAVMNTVLILTPRSWGSGIVIGKGLVLTNAHVIGFDEKPFNPIEIRWKDRKVKAQVVFNSPKSSSLDVALLQYNRSFGPSGISISTSYPKKGEEVVAIGFPLQIDNEPSLSKGIVSSAWDKSLGFSTSCKINSGYSGGPIVKKDGSLLGIAIGIMKEPNCYYPEINICMATSTIAELFRTYVTTGDISCFKQLLFYDDSWLRAVINLPKSKY